MAWPCKQPFLQMPSHLVAVETRLKDCIERATRGIYTLLGIGAIVAIVVWLGISVANEQNASPFQPSAFPGSSGTTRST